MRIQAMLGTLRARPADSQSAEVFRRQERAVRKAYMGASLLPEHIFN